jgi:hypothetical protein
MASQNKKNKAKNSFLYNGNEAQKIAKLKRVAYYIKADRLKIKKELKEML